MLTGLYTKISDAKVRNQELSSMVDQQTAVNDEMRYAVEHSAEENVIADAARRELGLVYPDETVYGSE